MSIWQCVACERYLCVPCSNSVRIHVSTIIIITIGSWSPAGCIRGPGLYPAAGLQPASFAGSRLSESALVLLYFVDCIAITRAYIPFIGITHVEQAGIVRPQLLRVVDAKARAINLACILIPIVVVHLQHHPPLLLP